jgi:hypothetical protein
MVEGPVLPYISLQLQGGSAWLGNGEQDAKRLGEAGICEGVECLRKPELPVGAGFKESEGAILGSLTHFPSGGCTRVAPFMAE